MWYIDVHKLHDYGIIKFRIWEKNCSYHLTTNENDQLKNPLQNPKDNLKD